ncbi:MAG: hypothetical protein AAGL49_13730, partial [Pseudomonadota bacterium]
MTGKGFSAIAGAATAAAVLALAPMGAGDAEARPGALGDLPAPSSKKYTSGGGQKASKGRSSAVVSKY